MIKTLQATIESNIDMWKFINDKYNFSDEKIRDCLSTNTVQKTLREQVQACMLEIAELKETNKAVLGRINENEKGSNDNMQSIQKELN